MEQPPERKELGFWMCTALVVGNTIGIGIYVLPASLAPYGFNAMLGWAITVVGMTVLARVFARLAREFPSADGPHAYIERTTGRLAAFVAIWCYWVSCWITNAAIAIGVVGYLNKVLPGLAGVPAALQALAMVWLFVVVNLLGVRAGGRVQVLTTVLKLLPMAYIVGLGALNGWTLLVGELTASLGRHEFLPARASRTNARGAPVVGLVVTGVLATAMVLMNYSKSLVEGFTFLTLIVTAANLPLYLLCAVALVVLARRGERRLPASVLVLGVIGTAYSIFAFVGLGHEPFLWSLVLGAAGLPVYWGVRRRRAPDVAPASAPASNRRTG